MYYNPLLMLYLHKKTLITMQSIYQISYMAFLINSGLSYRYLTINNNILIVLFDDIHSGSTIFYNNIFLIYEFDLCNKRNIDIKPT